MWRNNWSFNGFGSQSGHFAVFLNSFHNKDFQKLIKNILSINLSHSQCWLSGKSVVKQYAEVTPVPVQICTSMWRSSEARDVQAGRRGDAVEGDGSGTTWWAPTDELIIHQAENLNFCHRSNCNFADWTAPDGLRVRMLSPRRQQGGIKSCLSWIGEHCVCPLWGLLFQNVAPHHSLY